MTQENLDLFAVINKIKDINNGVCDNLVHFRASTGNGLYTSTSQIELTEEGELKKHFKALEESLDNVITESLVSVEKNDDALTEKSMFVKQLQTQLKQLEREYETKKNLVEDLKSKYEKSEKELQEMEMKKLKVQAYKLVTGTSFSYKQNETSGYIGKMGSDDTEPFIFKHSDYTPEQIQEKMWELVESVARKQS